MNKIDIRPVVKNILLFVSFVFLVAVILWGLQWFSISLYGFFEKKAALKQQNFLASAQNSNLEAVSISQNLLPSRNWQVEDLKIDAGAAISVETDLLAQKKVLFKKDEAKILPIASLSKLMTALVVLENYNLSRPAVISEAAVLQEGEQGELKAGQSLSIKNLLYIMLI